MVHNTACAVVYKNGSDTSVWVAALVRCGQSLSGSGSASKVDWSQRDRTKQELCNRCIRLQLLSSAHHWLYEYHLALISANGKRCPWGLCGEGQMKSMDWGFTGTTHWRQDLRSSLVCFAFNYIFLRPLKYKLYLYTQYWMNIAMYWIQRRNIERGFLSRGTSLFEWRLNTGEGRL